MKPVPEPALASLSPRGQAWEMTRYRAYQAYLAGHAIGETFGRATEFLKLATANNRPSQMPARILHREHADDLHRLIPSRWAPGR